MVFYVFTNPIVRILHHSGGTQVGPLAVKCVSRLVINDLARTCIKGVPVESDLLTVNPKTEVVSLLITIPNPRHHMKSTVGDIVEDIIVQLQMKISDMFMLVNVGNY